MSTKKSLIIYHFFEKDSLYIENLQHFLTFGYSLDNDYCIIIAGDCSLRLPQAENIQYFFSENKNNDYGGYCEFLSTFEDIEKYNFFIFINSSVRGPFQLPGSNEYWTERYTRQIVNDVGLVGGTICVLHDTSLHAKNYQKKWGKKTCTHVQTMTYAMNKQVLLFLMDKGFFNSSERMTKNEVIENYEIRLSQLILEAGWSIKCLLPEYNLIDYRQPHIDVNPTSFQGDPCGKDCYYGRTISPYEGLFIKTNRGIYSNAYLRKIALTYSSAIYTKNKLPALFQEDIVRRYFLMLPENIAYKKLSKHQKYKNVLTKYRDLRKSYACMIKEYCYQKSLVETYKNSSSYRLTAPMRYLSKIFRLTFF